MVPGRNGSILDGWVAVDRIGVWNRIKRNPLVAWVGIQACKMVDVGSGRGRGRGFHFYIRGIGINIYI